MGYRENVKPWFETEDKPTQVQFYQLFDWLWFKDEVIPNLDSLANKLDVSVYGGQRVLFGEDGAFVMLAHSLLEKVIVLPSEDANISIGNAQAAQDLLPEIPMSAANGEVVVLNLYAKNQRTIYFNNVPAGSYGIFIWRKLTALPS